MRNIRYINSQNGVLVCFKFCVLFIWPCKSIRISLPSPLCLFQESGWSVVTNPRAARFMVLAWQFWKGRLLHNEIQLCLQNWANWTAIPWHWMVCFFISFFFICTVKELTCFSCKKHLFVELMDTSTSSLSTPL